MVMPRQPLASKMPAVCRVGTLRTLALLSQITDQLQPTDGDGDARSELLLAARRMVTAQRTILSVNLDVL